MDYFDCIFGCIVARIFGLIFLLFFSTYSFAQKCSFIRESSSECKTVFNSYPDSLYSFRTSSCHWEGKTLSSLNAVKVRNCVGCPDLPPSQGVSCGIDKVCAAGEGISHPENLGSRACIGNCLYESSGIGVGLGDGPIYWGYDSLGESCIGGDGDGGNGDGGGDGDGGDGDGGDGLDPDGSGCREFWGFRICDNDPPFCFRSPAGNLLCPGRDSPNCEQDQSGGICFSKPPPPNSERGPDVTVCRDFSCIPFVPYRPPSDDDDGDDDDNGSDPPCDPNDPDCESQGDCPPNDPGCENDDDSDSPRAEDSGCETDTPNCSDMSSVECQILMRTHRTKCEVAHGNKLIEDFRDKSVAEQRETNAKLKALKDHLTTNHNNALTHHEQQITRLVDESRSVKSAVDEVKVSVSDASSSIGSRINSQTEILGGKLDAIQQAISDSGSGGGGGPVNPHPGNGDLVDAIGQQTSDLIGDGYDAGGGATDADLDALRVRVVGDGEIGSNIINRGGFIQGGGCPTFPPLTLGGVSWELDSIFWCDFLAIVRAVMILIGAWWSVMILLGRG